MAIQLDNEPVCLNQTVYDVCYGPGKVAALKGDTILVTFGGKGRPRQYNSNGMTGKSCLQTLFHRPPCIIKFPKDETKATKLACALKDVMKIFNHLIETPQCPPVQGCCQPEDPCEQWR